jgi:hypothetical protein
VENTSFNIQLGQKLLETPAVDGGGPEYMLALRKDVLHRGVDLLRKLKGHRSDPQGYNSIIGVVWLDKHGKFEKNTF